MFGDSVRGFVIAVLALVVALLPGVPNAPVAPTWLLIGAGLILQLGLFALRRSVQRQERAHGMDGHWLPTLNHLGGLLGDGLTVLLVAIAVFQSMLARATVI